MAEEFEQYHVPQQSRRDKLRVLGTQNHLEQSLQNCSSFGGVSFYDQSSLVSSYLQNCITNEQKSTNQHFGDKAHLARNSSPGTINKGVSFTGYGLGESSSRILMNSSSSNASVMDLQTSTTQLNPNVQLQDFYKNINTPHQEGFKYNLDQSFHSSSGKGLSLSLSSHQNYIPGSGVDGGGGGVFSWDNNEVGPVSLGYFMGYASMLKGSGFLKPAQQLLDELCYGARGIYGERFEVDESALICSLSENNAIIDDTQSCRDGSDNTSRRKSRLISLLHEVCRRYKQYYQQVQEVVASFESVTGLSNAAPFANMALNSLIKHFRSLKNAITHQLQFATKSQDKDEIPSSGNSKRGLDYQRPFQVGHRPVWRPQRGLPDHAVRVLKAWLYEHFLHPYPTDSDKVMLAKQTGLSRNQVSNWFINARVRLWKPMVEEIHTLETQLPQETSQRRDCNVNGKSGSNFYANDSNCSAEYLDFRSKHSQSSRNEQQEVHLSYDNSSRHPYQGAISSSMAGGSNGVSLTLGLHQNISSGLSKPFPGNAARRFGLDESSQGYVVGEFEAQNRQFGRDTVGGQLLHDFVG
ncbi:hypothetical protein Leryth_020486 [Lithospermum erythrorhizon]|nr:hypothetical protein Leryth_020486 [Lithospermum erythrorhizon]